MTILLFLSFCSITSAKASVLLFSPNRDKSETLFKIKSCKDSLLRQTHTHTYVMIQREECPCLLFPAGGEEVIWADAIALFTGNTAPFSSPLLCFSLVYDRLIFYFLSLSSPLQPLWLLLQLMVKYTARGRNTFFSYVVSGSERILFL